MKKLTVIYILGFLLFASCHINKTVNNHANAKTIVRQYNVFGKSLVIEKTRNLHDIIVEKTRITETKRITKYYDQNGKIHKISKITKFKASDTLKYSSKYNFTSLAFENIKVFYPESKMQIRVKWNGILETRNAIYQSSTFVEYDIKQNPILIIEYVKNEDFTNIHKVILNKTEKPDSTYTCFFCYYMNDAMK
jgi:hypothetical protein